MVCLATCTIKYKRSVVEFCAGKISLVMLLHIPLFFSTEIEVVTYNQPHSKVVFYVAAYSVCNLISGVHHLAFIIDPPKEIFPLGE